MLFRLAWRNLWRRPVRTGLNVFGIAFASGLLVFVLSFEFGVYDAMKTNTLKLFDGFAQIQPQGYAADPDIRKTIDSVNALAAQASRLRGVTAAAPRAATFALLAKGQASYGAAVEGVDPATEPEVSTLYATIRRGRYLKADDSGAIVMGADLARNLGLAVGDDVALLGSALDGGLAVDRLRLVGVFQTGVSDLDQIAEMPLTRFQTTFAMGGRANVVALSGRSVADVGADIPRLRAIAQRRGLTVQNWGGLEPALKQAIELDLSSGVMLYASLVVVVVFITLNTLMMSVLERTKELGTLLAIGMGPGLIGRMVWIELLLLTLAGASLGMMIGGGGALWVQRQGVAFGEMSGLLAQWGLPRRLYPEPTLVTLLAGPSAILISVAIAGIAPYLRVRRLRPILAMAA
jgi:ABC-type lipoprotein release transport system permease subunit